MTIYGIGYVAFFIYLEIIRITENISRLYSCEIIITCGVLQGSS
jgi:hypothetical protein